MVDLYIKTVGIFEIGWKLTKIAHLEGFQIAQKWKTRICRLVAPHTKNIMCLYYRATPICGWSVITFLHISNRLAVKHKKRISPLGGATYQKYYRPILWSYPNLWGVGIMTLIRISNRLAVLGKWAQLDPPLPAVPVPAYAFHEFASYGVGELKRSRVFIWTRSHR